MKRLFKFSIFVAALGLMLMSCLKNDNNYEFNFRISYGTIEVIDQTNAYRIVLDNGTKLNVVSNLTSGYIVKDGQRVIADYTPLASRNTMQGNSTDVRLNRLYNVLSKKSVAQSFIDQEKEKREDSIGHNRINVVDAWFGGKYLNVNFGIMPAPSGLRNFINVVRDDVSTPPEPAEGLLVNDTVYLRLRHNSYNDDPDPKYIPQFYFGRVSFDISNLLPEGKTEVPVKLSWTNYADKQRSDSGIFKLGSTTKAAMELDNANYLEIE